MAVRPDTEGRRPPVTLSRTRRDGVEPGVSLTTGWADPPPAQKRPILKDMLPRVGLSSSLQSGNGLKTAMISRELIARSALAL